MADPTAPAPTTPAKPPLSLSPSTAALIATILSLISGFVTHYMGGSNAAPAPAQQVSPTPIPPPLPVPLPSSSLAFRVITDAASPEGKALATYVARVGVPCLIVQTADGSVVLVERLLDASDVVAIAKRLRAQ